jgi:nucleoside phosphorylase
MAVDIVLAFATDTEWNAFKEIETQWHSLPSTCYVSTFNAPHYFLTPKGYRIAVLKAHYMGQVNAAAMACRIIYEFQPQLILSLGVAAGIPGKSSILDFLIPAQIHDLSLGKLTKAKRITDGRTGYCCNHTVSLLQEFFRDIAKYYPQETLQDKQLKKLNEKHKRSPWRLPQVRTGTVLCDNIVRDDGGLTKPEVLDTRRKAVGCEMESFGFTEAITNLPHNNGLVAAPRFAMIKGVVDFAIGKKSSWQPVVAPAVVRAAVDFLDNPPDNFLVKPSKHDQRDYKNVVRLALSNWKDTHTDTEKAIDFALMESLLEELDHTKDSYSESVLSVERDFLIRAKPAFMGTVFILATSIDSVSRFWRKSRTNEFASDYLKVQTQNPHGHPTKLIQRLFAFSSMEEAHRHAGVLDLHAAAYGNVYVCSINAYKHIIGQAVEFSDPADLLETDFAVVRYPGLEGRNFLRTLGKGTFRRADADSQEDLRKAGLRRFDIPLLEAIFEAARSTRKGGSYIVPVGHSSYHVLSWDIKMSKDRAWPEALERLFPKPDRDAVHMVFLEYPRDVAPSTLKRAFAEIKNAILKVPEDDKSLATKYNITDVWFGTRMRDIHEVKDCLTGADLDLGAEDKTELVITMKFKSQDDLVRFYNDRDHSAIRLKLNKLLCAAIAIVSRNDGKGPRRDFTVALGQMTEAICTKYLKRRDFTSGDEICDIVAYDPDAC